MRLSGYFDLRHPMTALNRKKIISTAAFAIVLVVIVIIAVLYLYNIFKWGNYPDWGFSFRIATGVNEVGVVGERGKRAGIRLGDRILKVNGKTFSSIWEVRAAVRWNLGEKNTYLLQRDGRQFEVTIPNIARGLKESFVRSGLPYIVGLCYVLIGILVFLMKPHQRISWIFLVFVTTFGVFFTFLFYTYNSTTIFKNVTSKKFYGKRKVGQRAGPL